MISSSLPHWQFWQLQTQKTVKQSRAAGDAWYVIFYLFITLSSLRVPHTPLSISHPLRAIPLLILFSIIPVKPVMPSHFSIPSLSRSLVARAQSVLNCHYPLFQPSFPYSLFTITIHYSLFIIHYSSLLHCFSGFPFSRCSYIRLSSFGLLSPCLSPSEIICLGVPSPRMSCPMSSSSFLPSFLPVNGYVYSIARQSSQ